MPHEQMVMNTDQNILSGLFWNRGMQRSLFVSVFSVMMYDFKKMIRIFFDVCARCY